MARKIQNAGTIDYIAGAAVESGDVLVIGDLLAIAIRDAKVGELAAADVEGIFEFPADDATAIAQGTIVYWDGAEIVTDEVDNTYAGVVASPKAETDAVVQVLINVGVPTQTT